LVNFAHGEDNAATIKRSAVFQIKKEEMKNTLIEAIAPLLDLPLSSSVNFPPQPFLCLSLGF